MPELPEVECVRRSLSRHILGRRIQAVRVNRRDVVRGGAAPAGLLAGQVVRDVLRHGKQLAVVGETGAALAVHLGMSGQLCVVPPKQRTDAANGSATHGRTPAHTHVLWSLADGSAVRFTDPRRFGGVWVFAGLDGLIAQRWSKLGPDALKIAPGDLAQRLQATRRGLKAALLDQALVAGLGNIYVDELLYAARLHPLTPADRITKQGCRLLVRRMRSLLARSIERGGSTLRDYVDAENRQGTQQAHHRVYGRAGLICKRRGCGQQLLADQIAGRTTAWCPGCQTPPKRA